MYKEQWQADQAERSSGRCRNILEVALDVRMAQNGSGDTFDYYVNGDIKLLQSVVDSWTPSLRAEDEAFDNAVRELVRAAIAYEGRYSKLEKARDIKQERLEREQHYALCQK